MILLSLYLLIGIIINILLIKYSKDDFNRAQNWIDFCIITSLYPIVILVAILDKVKQCKFENFVKLIRGKENLSEGIVTKDCMHCGWSFGKHRVNDHMCPDKVDENGWSHGWLETQYERWEGK
jgi:hypothetical protein